MRTGKCSFLPEEREWYQRLYDYGLEDTFRKLNPTVNDKFSWFDYRSKGFDDNRGLRIDHILVNRQLAERCVDVGIALDIRAMENRQITHQSGQSLNRKATWIWQIGRIIVRK